MASQHHELLLLLSSLLLSILSISSSTKSPETLVLPVKKDATTLQYLTGIYQRTPLVPVKLVVDIGSRFLWVDCDKNYVSSSYRPAECNSAECSLAESSTCSTCNDTPRPGCNNNTCGLFPENTITKVGTSGDVINDVVVFRSVHGYSATVPHFLFTCGSSFLLEGLAGGVQGMAGFGRTRVSIPNQLSSVFNIHPQFALCLFSSPSSNGFLFVGNDGTYNLPGGIDISRSLMRTPLILNPVSTSGISVEGEASSEYFIGVSSIKIDGKAVNVNTTLLSIDESSGVGGTKLSTVTPFTTLETSIYKSVTKAFIKAAKAKKMKSVVPVAPFKTCFSSESIKTSDVPSIELVLGSSTDEVYWRVLGANSMVEVKEKGVVCLGLMDGGLNPQTSIVIGGHQMENHFLQFDLATSILWFSPSLLLQETSCADFHFRDVA